MRIFLPVTASELESDLPECEWFVKQSSSGSGADDEWAEYEATVEASLASLERVRDSEDPVARRVVLAVEVDVEPNSPTVTPLWDSVVAILVDGSQAEPAVRRACVAQSQEEADEALDELLEHPLEWYDIAERARLCKELIH